MVVLTLGTGSWYGMVWYGMVVLGTGDWIINFNQGRIRERQEETRVMDKG